MFKDFDWKSTIAESEKVKLEFGISKVYAVALLAVLVIAALAVANSNIYVGVAILLLGIAYYFYLTKGRHFAFTDRRVLIVDAFLGREIVSIDYNQITDMQFEQSPFDMMGGWGSLTINSPGTHAPLIKIAFVNNPQKIRKELDEIREIRYKKVA